MQMDVARTDILDVGCEKRRKVKTKATAKVLTYTTGRIEPLFTEAGEGDEGRSEFVGDRSGG